MPSISYSRELRLSVTSSRYDARSPNSRALASMPASERSLSDSSRDEEKSARCGFILKPSLLSSARIARWLAGVSPSSLQKPS